MRSSVCSLLVVAVLAFSTFSQQAAAQSATGVPISYELPSAPGDYLVTLAIVDPKNPDWIISTFVAGAHRQVTPENKGRFTETWDGLDENFMPVPPGDYALKGIYMPARKWPVDGEYHAITPKFATGASSWMPSPGDWKTPIPFGGDPVNAPMGDIAVGPNGVAVFYYSYLENGTNNPMFDLKKPVDYEQFIRAFPSGGAGGGTATATDGETVWSFCNEGGPKYVYRADQKPFGNSQGANRTNGYLPEGWVTSMAAWRSGGKSYVAIAQRGKIVSEKGARHVGYHESATEAVNKITLHDGENGKILAELPITLPRSVAVQNGTLYALHAEGTGFAVSSVAVGAGIAQGTWQRLLTVPAEIQPFDMEVDSHGRIFVSDEVRNHVFQLGRDGKILATIGRQDAQKPGTYDPLTLMLPGKLATWIDPEGNDRLLIVENGGPNRVAEWTPDGKLIREFLSYQTKANDGYVVDPEDPEHVYVPGQKDTLIRFRVDYPKRTWTVDAVWPLPTDPRAPEIKKPRLIRAEGRMYLVDTAGGRKGAFNVLRLAEDGWHLSASILRLKPDEKQPAKYFFWHDANNNSRVDDEELTATEVPGNVFTYQGQNWGADFALLALNQGGQDLWRVAPSGFDPHGNPIFKEWTKVLTDPVFTARSEGKVDAVHGGNEQSEKFTSDWMQADGTAAEGFYIQARGGKNFSANEGSQHKISHYVPEGSGGYKLKWRVGRTALDGLAKPGEMYGGMRIQTPLNGLIGVIDQSRCGILLYNEDGLYVDTIFPDGRKFKPQDAGMYPQPGEFFAGFWYPNKDDGKIYIGMGKYTPLLFEAEGWSMKENPVRPLTTVQRTVSIAAAQIATPPEIALTLRGGVGTAKFARFSPANGGVALDGSLAGWESCEPVRFEAAKDQQVEVRCAYDPEHLYLRWHARLPGKFEPKALPPLKRIFTHDQLADTFSFYLQGDVNAKPGGKPEGRPGDVRFVFGVFKKGDTMQPVAVGMYPSWTGPGKASPQTYRTPVGSASFAHVGPIPGAQLAYAIDPDGKGLVLTAALPRAAIPQLQKPFSGGLRTLGNFEATFGGHGKVWWANSDGSASRETYDEPTEARLYPGSWAPIEFQGFNGGLVIRNWLVCGPFGGPGAEKFSWNPNGKMPGSNQDQKQAVRELFDGAQYPPDDRKVNLGATFSGEMIRGYWPDPKKLSWKPATIEDLDTRVLLGQAAQVWYGATWIYVPAETSLEFAFQGHRQTYLRWFVNADPVPLKPSDYKDVNDKSRTLAVRSVTLHAGWNQVYFRGYCEGYSPFKVGLVLNGTEDQLWKVKLSAVPPQ